MKRLFLGNEAVARGLYEAGCRVVSSYPGTPSTEITEFAAKYDEIYCEWAPNEKVAMEVASGAAISGARAFCGMKHVGLNVAADPLFTLSYTGISAGLVIGVADDPGMHSSQNEQDSRHYARASKTMMLEPADSEECLDYTKLAFELSERFDTPVILRLTTRISHSRSLVETDSRQEREIKEFVKNPRKYVMVPGMARPKHKVVEDRILAQTEWAESAPINTVEYNGTKTGVITAGIAYQYAKEALGDKASYLKLGCVYPLPVNLIKDFASRFETVYVIEELDDYIETHCRKHGIEVVGKDAFSFIGEYTPRQIAKAVLGEESAFPDIDLPIPGRPPVLCPGCPHRALFYVLKKLKVFVSGDIGCYSLGVMQPLDSMDTLICMGAGVSFLHGRNVADPANAKKSVGVIGDSTFAHSGITGLVDIAYNKSDSVVIILDNSITGMTGHQDNPLTGRTIKGDPALAIDLEMLVKSLGIERFTVVDPNDMEETERVIRTELEAPGPSVVVARRPCALLKYVKHNAPLHVDTEKCRSCRMCMRIGCPAISFIDGKANINAAQCVGCGVCRQLCKFGAIG